MSAQLSPVKAELTPEKRFEHAMALVLVWTRPQGVDADGRTRGGPAEVGRADPTLAQHALDVVDLVYSLAHGEELPAIGWDDKEEGTPP